MGIRRSLEYVRFSFFCKFFVFSFEFFIYVFLVNCDLRQRVSQKVGSSKRPVNSAVKRTSRIKVLGQPGWNTPLQPGNSRRAAQLFISFFYCQNIIVLFHHRIIILVIFKTRNICSLLKHMNSFFTSNQINLDDEESQRTLQENGTFLCRSSSASKGKQRRKSVGKFVVWV